MHCPHCKCECKMPPNRWGAWQPWHCSSCGGLFGLDGDSPFPIPEKFKPLTPLLGFDIARRWCFYAGRQNAYTYALCYPTGLPFYVGSGIFERALQHESETRSKKRKVTSPKHRAIQSIWECNEEVWYCFLGLFAKREEATFYENFFIDLWGQRHQGGILTNISGETQVECSLPLSHVGFPEEPEIMQHPDAIGKWKHSIRVFHHADFVIAPPYQGGIVTGGVGICPGCGKKGQIIRDMRDKKLLCSYCAHYFMEGAIQPPDPGTFRQFFVRTP